MVPFVERNYNLVELGPRGTGKSHLFQQISPYAHLISGGKATVAKMFVNNATGQRGLVCQYDVVCFDEVSGISFDQKDGVNIMKGYMASGQFSRGKENIRADGGIVMVGNFDVDVEQQQRVGHLLSPLPPEMRNDTAFMDRLHAFAPGWDFPEAEPERAPDRSLRSGERLPERVLEQAALRQPRVNVMQGRVHLGGALSGRDIEAVNKTVSGLVKLLFPEPEMPVPDEDLEWIVRLALESRRRVKEQQKRCFKSEFRNTHFSYTLGADGVEQFVSTPELHSDEAIETDPLPPGQVWAVSMGSPEAGAGPVSHRGDVRARRRREDSQPAAAAGVPREREGRRAEPLHAGQGTGRRPRSPRARVLDPDARHGRGQDRRRAWACRCWWPSAVRCSARTRAAGRSSSAR